MAPAPFFRVARTMMSAQSPGIILHRDRPPTMKTLVIQSHRWPLPCPWLRPCLESVRLWADCKGYEYRFMGDEIFTPLSMQFRQKAGGRIQVASDLARLYALRGALQEGYERAVWCDADFLVFTPDSLALPEASMALGREVWVQPRGNAWRTHVKVHNAFMFFRRGDAFLDFYIHAAERMVAAYRGAMVPQFIGPKFLTALHNLVQFEVVENAAMLSPWVSRDLLRGQGPALSAMVARSTDRPAGANLCQSLLGGDTLSQEDAARLVQLLLVQGWPWGSAQSPRGPGA